MWQSVSIKIISLFFLWYPAALQCTALCLVCVRVFCFLFPVGIVALPNSQRARHHQETDKCFTQEQR